MVTRVTRKTVAVAVYVNKRLSINTGMTETKVGRETEIY